MMRIFYLLLASLALLPLDARAASTINPTQPAQNSTLSSGPVRNNFLAAYNDINNILGMYAGPSAPAAPTNLQSWADTSASPIYVFKYFNQQNNVWVAYGSLNINTNVYTPVFSTAGFLATPPLTVSVNSGVVTYGISLGSNFAVTSNALHLTAIVSGNLIANCGASSAEPTSCTWTSFADRAISSVNGTIPSRVGGVWATVNTGTSGHSIPFLDTTNQWSARQTVYLGASTLPSALTTTVNRASNADGTASTYEASAFGANGEFACVRANNTATSPAALTNGSLICSMSAYGYDGTSYSGTIASYFRMYAAGTWSNTSHPTYARIATVPSAATAAVDRLSVESDGGVTVPPTVTGGSKGAGTLNATGLYVSNDVVATLTAAQTLSSKTLTSPIVTGTLGGTGVIPNAALVNAATTVNGQTCTLGSTCTVTASAASVTVGTTTVTGGVSGNIFYNNAGVLGEKTPTGTGNPVLDTSPTLVTPNIGAATATSINGLTVSSSTGTLTIANGKTLTASNSLALAGTDSTVMTFPGATDTVMGLGATQTVTGTKSFNSSRLALNGATSGTTTLNAAAVAGTTTLTLPAVTDTIVARTTADTLTNKTINGASNTLTVRLGSDVSGTLPIANNCPGATGASSSTFLRGDCTWATPAGAGNVTGPGSSTSGNIVRWNGSTGTSIADSVVTLDGSGNLIGAVSVQRTGGVAIQGTNTNNNASAGYVGEYIEQAVPAGSAVGITSSTPRTVAVITLTPGDWNISANMNITGGSTTTVAYVLAGITTTNNAAASGNDTTAYVYPGSYTPFVTAPIAFPITNRRVSITTNTDFYMTIFTNHAVSTLQAWGTIRAWRVR